MSSFQAHTTTPLQIISVKEVAQLLGYSAAYIRNQVRKNPSAFPPILKSKKGTLLRFRQGDVLEWLADQQVQKRAMR